MLPYLFGISEQTVQNEDEAFLDDFQLTDILGDDEGTFDPLLMQNDGDKIKSLSELYVSQPAQNTLYMKHESDDSEKDSLNEKRDGSAKSQTHSDHIEGFIQVKRETICQSNDHDDNRRIDNNDREVTRSPNTVTKNPNKRFHIKEKFPCHLCDMQIISKAALRIHIEGVHKHIKPFWCSLCDKAFTQQGSLKQHMTVHTGEKPFTCKQCMTQFSQRSSLNKHVRYVHQKIKRKPAEFKSAEKVGEKLFTCAICEQTFTWKASLKQHLNAIHHNLKPFCCTICGTSFSSNSKVRRHEKTHTGEKSVTCDLCKKGFWSKLDLSRHIDAVHHKLKPFLCVLCGKSFSIRSNWRKHKMIHEIGK